MTHPGSENLGYIVLPHTIALTEKAEGFSNGNTGNAEAVFRDHQTVFVNIFYIYMYETRQACQNCMSAR